MSALKHTTQILFSLTLLLFISGSGTAAVDYLVSSKIEDGFYFETNNLELDSLRALGINNMVVFADLSPSI